MQYKYLLFDIDNTLLDFNQAEKFAIICTLRQFDLPYDENTTNLYSEINLSFWKQFELGEIPKEAIFEGRFKSLLSVLGEEREVKAISDFYFKQLAAAYFKMPHTDEVLTYLKNKGYLLYAATNGFAFTQYNRIEKSGIADYFENIFISEKVGANKPDKKYFEFCINSIGCSKAEALIIGDSLSSDILGGINAGIDACWINLKNEQTKYNIKFEICSLKELKSIL